MRQPAALRVPNDGGDARDPAPPAKPRRLHELDALRGIAAMGVVFWHYAAHFGAKPLSGLLHPAYQAGFLLVDFFFVLSGFVIARAYWRPARQGALAVNVWARVARLYPLHLVTLLLTAVLLHAVRASGTVLGFEVHDDLWDFLLNLVLLNQSGLQRGMSFNTPAWSISAEFIVNLMFLAFIAARARLRAGAVLLGGGLVLAGAAISNLPLVAQAGQPSLIDGNLARCGLGFGAGVLLALADPNRIRWPRWCFDAAAMLGLAALLLLLSSSHQHPPLTHYLASIAVAMICVAFVPHSRLAGQLLDRGPLIWLGDRSFSIYLVHFPLQLLILLLGAQGSGLDFDDPFLLLGFTALVLFVSAVSYRWLELPAQAALLRLRRPASASTATSPSGET